MAEQPWGVWGQLTVNLLAVAFFISVWAHLQFWFSRRLRPIRHAAFGVAMGLGAVASMLQAFRLEAGVIFDFRFPLIAVAGFSGGPLGASVAALFAGAYRVYVGGPGMPAGLMGIGLMACIGTAGYLLFGRTPRTWHVGTLALAVGAGSTLSFLALPPDLLASVASSVMAPVVALGIVATFMAGLTILHTKRIAAERLLLRAAIAQAPDYQYVKDTRSQFVAVNTQVARHNGFERTDDLVGMTDADIAEGDRARALLQQEASIMQSGEALIEHEERLGEGHGEKWFLTSKVPLRDEEGEIIGIAGVTRDITQRRKMEQDLVDSRNLLSFAMSEMADGLAMFDRDGHLIYCNERYRSTFPLTARARKEGAHIRDILREVVQTGEQVNISGESSEDWINEVEASLKTGGEEQVNLYDGRWLHLRTRTTESGASMVVVSDVTSIKQSEEHLLSLTGELRRQATTDGLTGLMNRGAFDKAIEHEVARTASAGADISLLMVDVDHFKKYNDTYGHPAGDECLRVVGKCLKMALRRSEDVVARYGGEEFVAILPSTSEDDAYQVAERVRQGLLELALPHKASPRKIVTVSIGIASYPAAAGARSVPQLILRADEALYEAKAAGRNRTMGWQPRHAHRAAGSAG